MRDVREAVLVLAINTRNVIIITTPARMNRHACGHTHQIPCAFTHVHAHSCMWPADDTREWVTFLVSGTVLHFHDDRGNRKDDAEAG